MIKDLDLSIEEFLKKNLKDQIPQVNFDISFQRPDYAFKSYPVIDVFLYDIAENTKRLASPMTFVKNSKTGTILNYSPLSIVCSYAVTVWTKDDDALNEHYILGEIMKVLLKYRSISENFLQGCLKNIKPLPVAFALRRGVELKSLSQLWQAMGIKPKPVLNYMVIVDVDVFKDEEIRLIKDIDTKTVLKKD